MSKVGAVPATGGAGLHEPLGKSVLGGTTAKKLGTVLGLATVGDLLRHFPRRYLRLGEFTAIDELPLGEQVMVLGEVLSGNNKRMQSRRGSVQTFVISDGNAEMELTFFNQIHMMGRLKVGARGLFAGTVQPAYRPRGRDVPSSGRRFQLTHPRMVMMDEDPDFVAARDRPWPVYPAGKGLESDQIMRSVRTVLDVLGEVPDPIPAEIRARHGLPALGPALQQVHRPAVEGEAYAAKERFRFEEAFVLQAALARRRAVLGARPATPRPEQPDGLLAAFEARLPFTLTAGQREVGEQIAADLARSHPMHRLLQGEVGSGKTLVALRAMLTVVDAGGQAALLAPTEVLAQQHYRSITAVLGPLAGAGMLGGAERATRVTLLTGSMSTAARRKAMLEAASGDAGIVIGTHALLQQGVTFADLGLVVVDEQHRFGVEQRDALRDKGITVPHLLVMTATPIPRTVAMTVFGDLETSTLRELPTGRSPIATHLVPLAERPAWYRRTWQRVAEEVAAGHQAYVVCPRIGEEGEGGDDTDGADGEAGDAGEAGGEGAPGENGDDAPRRPARGVVETLAELRAAPELAGLRIEMLHGRRPAEERDAVMAAFARGEVQVLVATTVIEVGVDVPNATTMVILDADRFGVSQLHQLRGRVGRGAAAGVCLLVTDLDADSPARARLEAVAATTDGFELARVDLEARREGDVLGARQSGRRSSLRLLRVLQDEKVIVAARHEATALVAGDPELTGHPALIAALDELLGEDKEAFLERG